MMDLSTDCNFLLLGFLFLLISESLVRLSIRSSSLFSIGRCLKYRFREKIFSFDFSITVICVILAACYFLWLGTSFYWISGTWPWGIILNHKSNQVFGAPSIGFLCRCWSEIQSSRCLFVSFVERNDILCMQLEYKVEWIFLTRKKQKESSQACLFACTHKELPETETHNCNKFVK